MVNGKIGKQLILGGYDYNIMNNVFFVCRELSRLICTLSLMRLRTRNMGNKFYVPNIAG